MPVVDLNTMGHKGTQFVRLRLSSPVKPPFFRPSRFLHGWAATFKAYLHVESGMSWGPVVVGVDNSAAAVGAAGMGERIARMAGSRCELVHAVRDAWAPLVAVNPDPMVGEMQALQLAVARETVNRTLKETASPRALAELTVRFGPPAVVLQDVIRESAPGLLILGGTHHSGLERRVGGREALRGAGRHKAPFVDGVRAAARSPRHSADRSDRVLRARAGDPRARRLAARDEQWRRADGPAGHGRGYAAPRGRGLEGRSVGRRLARQGLGTARVAWQRHGAADQSPADLVAGRARRRHGRRVPRKG